MIGTIIELLEEVKKNKQSGRYISIAIGEYKYPHTFTEGVKLLRRKLWKNAP